MKSQTRKTSKRRSVKKLSRKSSRKPRKAACMIIIRRSVRISHSPKKHYKTSRHVSRTRKTSRRHSRPHMF